jgi:hypothetical protein
MSTSRIRSYAAILAEFQTRMISNIAQVITHHTYNFPSEKFQTDDKAQTKKSH